MKANDEAQELKDALDSIPYAKLDTLSATLVMSVFDWWAHRAKSMLYIKAEIDKLLDENDRYTGVFHVKLSVPSIPEVKG